MASTIKLKNSTTAGNAPSSLAQGEVAINVADGGLFYGTVGGTSVSSSLLLSDITASGNISGSINTDLTIGNTGSFGYIQMNDGKEIAFGNSQDLRIFHDGSHSRIKDGGTGQIKIQGGTAVNIISPADESMGVFTANNGVDLYFNNNKKFEVQTGGINVTGHITASGNISSSATIIANGVNVDSAVTFAGNKRILYNTNDQNLVVNDSSLKVNSHITASGNISASGNLISSRQFDQSSTTDNHLSSGDIVYFGSTTSMTQGRVYYFNSSGNWAQTDADAESSAKGLLAIALGTASDTDGMLLRGMFTLDYDPGTIADVLYLSTTAGRVQNSAPSGDEDIVRIIGYCLDSTNGQIWFNPDNTFVEVNA